MLSKQKLNIKSSELLREVLSSYRQSIVSGRRGFYSNEVGIKQKELARINAEVSFFPNISKYSLEIVVVVSTLLIAAMQFIQSDAEHAVAVLSIFLAASTRIAPAILRLQQNLISMKTLSGSALETLEFAETLNEFTSDARLSFFNTVHDGFIPSIKVKNVSMIYPASTQQILKNINFSIEEFSITALVGKSGSGKTTLVDIILGIHNPTEGQITISDVAPLVAIHKWPGAIAYVPQEVKIINGTVKENIALGYLRAEVEDIYITEAVINARLGEFVSSLPDGMDTYIGDGGAFLSGGQKQRLGIARALLTKPKLLILDEATNAMDRETEIEFFKVLQKLQLQTTILIIAHADFAIKNAHKIMNLINGELQIQNSQDYFTSIELS